MTGAINPQASGHAIISWCQEEFILELQKNIAQFYIIVE